MDKSVFQIAWPGVGYNEPEVFGNTSACFLMKKINKVDNYDLSSSNWNYPIAKLRENKL